MEIYSFDTLPSTQLYLIDAVKSGEIKSPAVVIASEQTDGVGSRDNSWQGGEGNFFASIAVDMDMLPVDLPSSSVAIYFAFLMRSVLGESVDDVWLKWPNDIYYQEEKIGGVVTKNIDQYLVVGIGVNLKKNQNGYSALDTDITPLILLNMFLELLEQSPSWKQVFSKYKIEFEQSKSYFTHKNSMRIDMKNALLCGDGSLLIEGKKVYSLR